MKYEIDKVAEVKAIDLNADPNTLPLEAIPGYVNAIGRRMAVDAWLVGKALARAKSLVQEAHRAGWREEGWRDWCAKNLGVSHETARKWIKIAEHFDSKDKIEGLTLEDAYAATGSKQTRKSQATKKQSKSTEAVGSIANVSTTTANEPARDEKDGGSGPASQPSAAEVRTVATVTAVEESEEADSLDADEDWGDSPDNDEDWGDGPGTDVESDEEEDVEELLDISFRHLDGVRGATTLDDAKQAANLLKRCLLRLAEVLGVDA
jgi:hypothetical protein